MKDLVKIIKLSDVYGEMLTPHQREMVEMYYSLNLSMGEIAQMKGVSRQSVHDALSKAEKELENIEEKIGYVAFLRGLKEIANKFPDEFKKEIMEYIDK